jgi:hypothetical protein
MNRTCETNTMKSKFLRLVVVVILAAAEIAAQTPDFAGRWAGTLTTSLSGPMPISTHQFPSLPTVRKARRSYSTKLTIIFTRPQGAISHSSI